MPEFIPERLELFWGMISAVIKHKMVKNVRMHLSLENGGNVFVMLKSTWIS